MSFAFSIFFLYMRTDKNPPAPQEGKPILPSAFKGLPFRPSPVTSSLITFLLSWPTNRSPSPPPRSLLFLLIRAGSEVRAQDELGWPGGRCVKWRWLCLGKVSEDLNDISRDSIRLPNSFHPSDERTSCGFQGDGAGAFSCGEWAQATQINSVSVPLKPLSGRSRLSLAEGRWGQGGTFRL